MVLTLTTLLGLAAAAIALGVDGRNPRIPPIPLWVAVLLLAIALLLQALPIGK